MDATFSRSKVKSQSVEKNKVQDLPKTTPAIVTVFEGFIGILSMLNKGSHDFGFFVISLHFPLFLTKSKIILHFGTDSIRIGCIRIFISQLRIRCGHPPPFKYHAKEDACLQFKTVLKVFCFGLALKRITP